MTRQSPKLQDGVLVLLLVLVLGAGTAGAWHATAQGWGLDDDLAGISLRDQSASRTRGSRVYVGGGLRGGK